MKIYIVQIDMSRDNDGTKWENADLAFKTKEQAEAVIYFKMTEYGVPRKALRIDELELV